MPIDLNDSAILVTGGAGFVGSHLVEELLKCCPKKIIIIDNLTRGNLENISSFARRSNVVFHRGDIRDSALLQECLSKTDYCFHLAALRINACAENPAEGFDVMVRSTFELLEGARKFGIKKLVFSSSASIYGLASTFPTPESESPYDNKTFYGACKFFGEQMLKSYHHMFGLEYVSLRYFNVYGPRMDTHGKYTEVMIRWLNCIQNRERPVVYGDGTTTMDFVYVTDVARANICAMKSDVTDEVFNIGNQRETSLSQLLSLLLKVNKASLEPIFKEESKVNPVRRRLADLRRAREILGFSPEIELEVGLKMLSDWYLGAKKVTPG